ncbi:MAG: XRE family transcriptional regulator [Aeromicrobium sp.]|uniref:helix-turn-helix domain-containing protein n=1 Tax=Aeromicrobium sp. TaxID=1871063 RepID=UPI0039E58FF8
MSTSPDAETPLNPGRLLLARKRQGLTITALASEANISTTSLSKYENGRSEPSQETISRLAEALAVNPSFLRGTDLDEIPEGAVSFRALTKTPVRQRDQGRAAGRIAIMINDWIKERFDLPPADIPSLTGREPETAAQEIRARWGLGERPIKNMIHLLEAHGVRVYSLTHDNQNLDAYCTNWRGEPFVFLNTKKTGERSRFDAAHELGHLVMHGEHAPVEGKEAENEANRFAAAFLMPARGVYAQRLHNARAGALIKAKSKWGVAAMALAHRANELGLMTEWAYRTACVDLSRMGYRSGEPGGIERESSKMLWKVLQQLHLEGEGIGTIAADLGLPPSEIRSHMFGLAPTALAGEGQVTSERANLRLV